jgi:cytochrome c-type biogenesis protein CcmH/NrfF
MTPVLACASHLLVDLPLFGGPVVMVIAAVGLMARSERRRSKRIRQAPSAGA